ncbi:MAG: DNA polymerase III subunit alpha, partial [Oscillospiraceae bacterium]
EDGSGAGSIAAYLVGITDIDPLKFNLIFERFLNPERISMPDFDIDFCYERRQEVIDYVVRKYGSDHVAQIITFGTMAARGAIRDVGRVMEIPYQTVDAVAKMVPTELKMTIKKALTVSPELANLYRSDDKIKELIDVAVKIEGMPRHASTHAAGVVITREAAQEYVPLSCNDGQIVTQFTMTTIEELGLLKMDFLGLRTLTVIDDTEKLVQKTVDPNFSVEKMDYGDAKVFEMLTVGDTCGTFQFESSGMRSVLMGLIPRDVEDLIAVISLYRPGPMDSIPTYIKNRHNPEGITYKHPSLAHILDVTNGCIVYQEQVMQIFRELAGFSYGQADLVRRAMSKKKHEVMKIEGQNFIYGSTEKGHECKGCVANGIPENIAKEIYDEMANFASYAFNKSHAAAYAVVAYQTAFLKCHYQKQYMAALLTSVLGNTDKVIEYTAECQRIGIKILPPDINKSDIGFTVEGENLRFGLLALKNVGQNLIRNVVENRKDGEYTSLYDFCKRLYGSELNKRAVETFIKSGAMDKLEVNRRTMIKNAEAVLKSVENDGKKNIVGQVSLFGLADEESKDEFILTPFAEFDQSELLQMEKDLSGLYLSGHPLDAYRSVLGKISDCTIKTITGDDENGKNMDGKTVAFACTIVKAKYLTTKSNAMMAFVTVEDLTGTMEMVVFPKTLMDCNDAISDNAVVVVHGKVSVKEDENAKILAEKVENIKNYEPKKLAAKPNSGLFIKVPSMESPEFQKAKELFSIFYGDEPVTIYLVDKNKYISAPKSLYVNLCDGLLDELKLVLGENAVVVK